MEEKHAMSDIATLTWSIKGPKSELGYSLHVGSTNGYGAGFVATTATGYGNAFTGGFSHATATTPRKKSRPDRPRRDYATEKEKKGVRESQEEKGRPSRRYPRGIQRWLTALRKCRKGSSREQFRPSGWGWRKLPLWEFLLNSLWATLLFVSTHCERPFFRRSASSPAATTYFSATPKYRTIQLQGSPPPPRPMRHPNIAPSNLFGESPPPPPPATEKNRRLQRNSPVQSAESPPRLTLPAVPWPPLYRKGHYRQYCTRNKTAVCKHLQLHRRQRQIRDTVSKNAWCSLITAATLWLYRAISGARPPLLGTIDSEIDIVAPRRKLHRVFRTLIASCWM